MASDHYFGYNGSKMLSYTPNNFKWGWGWGYEKKKALFVYHELLANCFY